MTENAQQMAFSPPPVDAGRLLKTALHEAAGKPATEAYPQGYVEGISSWSCRH